jgi:hypothetical protein
MSPYSHTNAEEGIFRRSFYITSQDPPTLLKPLGLMQEENTATPRNADFIDSKGQPAGDRLRA